ncbi:MAG: glucose-6-phosphate isomerase [Proteobacteria bacterium]|nr:glucose-6-phosphate isomerase [Pseudomonadota bacterium]
MTDLQINQTDPWKRLEKEADRFQQPTLHLKALLSDHNRFDLFSKKSAGIFFDYSRQRVDENTMALLFELAKKARIMEKFNDMMNGKKVNVTENRAALHTATRNLSGKPIHVDGQDVMPELERVKEDLRSFSEKIHQGKIKGSTGRPFSHAVVIGIGGSYLGTEFVATALSSFADKNIRIHFLSNVDFHNFDAIKRKIDPLETLFISISKSNTTAETLANEKQAWEYLKNAGLDPSKHFVSVTGKDSPPSAIVKKSLQTFHMFDYIGGRYSVSSAVGGLPLSLFLGFDRFCAFLEGASEMDTHARTASIENNLPLIAALIDTWNNNFLKYTALGIIPYASPLSKLAPHIQQLYMESNGKSVTTEGKTLNIRSGWIVFGEPGTNAQHSFFQLAHQGMAFPIDFIGVIHPQYEETHCLSKGVTNHQELWANLISQPQALAMGKADADPTKSFSGNRPSSTLVLNDLSPENVGKLLSFYEARTLFQAFLWDINPFDQFGVELGKVLAGNIRKQMAKKNENNAHQLNTNNPISDFYLNALFSGNI